MPIHTRSSTHKVQEDNSNASFILDEPGVIDLETSEVEQQPEKMDSNGPESSVHQSPSPVSTDFSGKTCEGCVHLRAEMEAIKREIAELRKFNFPAEKQPCTSKENMQMIQCLERNNTSLITAVEALSRQVLTQRSAEPTSSVGVSNHSEEIQESVEADGFIPESGSKKRKKHKKKLANQQRPADATRSNAKRQTKSKRNHNVSPHKNSSVSQQSQDGRREVCIVGDSILKNIQGWKMSSENCKVKVSSFPGCTTEDMQDHIKPIMRRNPHEVILHVGTNSLRSSTSERACAEQIVDLATKVDRQSVKVSISAILCRSDDNILARKALGVNKIIKQFANQNGWEFIDNKNIKPEEHLNRSGLHLNTNGTAQLAMNFKEHLNNN